ncbi:MAG: M50 family metallopeptidase [Coriobacteriales bacterium]|jgi:regulator of sigma E protease
MTTVLGIIVALLILTLLILVHEAAHTLTARLCGMRVTELFVGLPYGPRFTWRSPRSGIRFGFSFALLGGYTKISGMSYQRDERLERALAVVNGRGEVEVGQVARSLDVTDDEAGILLDSLADIGSIEPCVPERGALRGLPTSFRTVARDARGLTVYDRGHDFGLEGSTAAGEPRPGDDAQAMIDSDLARTYDGAGFWKRAITLLAGIISNLLLAILLVMAFYMFHGVSTVSPYIAQVTQGSEAEAAGIRAGDALLSVDGVDVSASYQDVSQALSTAVASGRSFEVTYLRNGESHQTTADPAESDGSGMFGVTYSYTTVRYGPVDAARAALSYAGYVATAIVELLVPSHTMDVLQQSSGIIGVVMISGKAASEGAWQVISLTAALSLSLGWMNLLPFPPLDGGKLLIEAIQAVTRRRVSNRVQMALSAVGMALMIALFVFMIGMDVSRIADGTYS